MTLKFSSWFNNPIGRQASPNIERTNYIRRHTQWDRNFFRCWRWFFDFTIYGPNLFTLTVVFQMVQISHRAWILNEEYILLSDLQWLFILIFRNIFCTAIFHNHFFIYWNNSKGQIANESLVIIAVWYIYMGIRKWLK